MNKAYMTVLKVLAFILVFVLGMVSSLLILAGAGVYAANNLSFNKLEGLGIKVDTSATFDEEKAQISIRDLTFVDLYKEISDIVALSDSKTMNDLSDTYGLILPDEGKSVFFDAVRVTPFGTLFTQEGIDQILKELQLGEMVGYDHVDNPNYNPDNPDSGERPKTWFNSDTGEYVWIVESIVCDYTLYQLVYEGVDVPEILDHVPIGEIFGYHKESDGVWKDKNHIPVHGIMAVIADKTLNNLEDTLGSEPMGYLLGYEFVSVPGTENGGYWIDPEKPDEEVPPFMQLVSNTPFSDLDSMYDQITIADLVPEDERENGYISLVNPATHLSEVSLEVNRVFSETPLHQFVACGAVEVPDASKFAEGTPLGNMNIKQLLEYAVLQTP